jgi:hypothetical protein
VTSSLAMMAGGLEIFWRRMCRLKKYGNHTVVSYLRNWLVGTEKTSVTDVSATWPCMDCGGGVWGVLTIQLLKGELLRLAYEAEDHAPRNEIQSSIETDCCDVSAASVGMG